MYRTEALSHIVASIPRRDLTLALLVPRVGRANDVNVAPMALVRFPSDDLAVLAPLLNRTMHLHPPCLLLLENHGTLLGRLHKRGALGNRRPRHGREDAVRKASSLDGRNRFWAGGRPQGEGPHRRGERLDT